MLFKKTGILGINARNLRYLSPFNPQKAIKIADDKLKTKAFLSARKISVPKLIGTIKNLKDLETFNFSKLPQSFVIKPNQGYGGIGIIPINSHKNNIFTTVDNKTLTLEELQTHIHQILRGYYSLKNHTDVAFFEQLIISHPSIGDISYKGLPDIRVIVHNMVPVMAMLRIPTKESQGKANLHQGAIGAGIDIAKGEITHLTSHNKIIKEIPGIGNIKGLKIPYWDQILEISINSQLATNLGYLAADIAIDRQQGPILLEINARPGLSIQIANQAKLRYRLEKIQDLEIKTISKAIRIAKDMFGFTIEKNISNLSGKKVISNLEKVEIIHDNGIIPVKALISTTKKNSVIDTDLAKQILALNHKNSPIIQESDKLKIKLKLSKEKIVSICKIDRLKKKKYNLIIGTKDLSNRFLIDPSLTISETQSPPTKHKNINIFNSSFNAEATDKKICKLIGSFPLLNLIKPINLNEEINKFKQNPNYNPQFQYNDHNFLLKDFRSELNSIQTDNSIFGKLVYNKIQELNDQLDLVSNIGNPEQITKISTKLYGAPIQSDFKIHKKNSPIQQGNLTAQDLKQAFEETLNQYGIQNWKIILKSNLISNCIINKNRKIFIKTEAKFTEARIKSLIIHEIETHLLTAENGYYQPYKLLNKGFAGYLKTQEGLAQYNQETNHGDINSNFNKLEAIRLCLNYSFSEAYKLLIQTGIHPDSALRLILRAKRGIHH